jgi:Spy/CpxP family protein refolding chaperone
MIYRRSIILAVLLFMPSGLVYAQGGPDYRSKYVGQETREIKTLSREDMEELSTGEGWGLAKAAELNGVPGPAHLLQMKSEIQLSGKQVEQIEQLYDEMKSQAVPLGLKLIGLERELNEAFATGRIDEENLKDVLTRISDVYGKLRFVHLSAHLKTPAILTAEQMKLYNELRGYTSNDPCKNVPEGHDPDMWKRHHNCE